MSIVRILKITVLGQCIKEGFSKEQKITDPAIPGPSRVKRSTRKPSNFKKHL